MSYVNIFFATLVEYLIKSPDVAEAGAHLALNLQCSCVIA